MRFGLVGRNIDYSFSKQYFSNKFENENLPHTYENLDINLIDELPKYLENNDFNGLNVTIPFKEKVIPFLDQLDPIVEEIGAVNCIQFKNNSLIGHNTDAFGFSESLKPLLRNVENRAIIFGNGGAAKAIKWALKNLNIPFQIVERTGELNYKNLNFQQLFNATILINTTPVGTYPNIDEDLPIPIDGLHENQLVYDLVYNPKKTKLLQLAEEKGATIKNGYEMLKLQADKSYEIWNS